jgi:hypothetical protein
MPAECSNQAGDSFSHLNLSSFDQDVDNVSEIEF